MDRNSRRRVDEYRLLGFLGKGGFGEVYVARSDSRPRELVALKVLRPDRSNDSHFRRRFEREIRAMEEVSRVYEDLPWLIRHGEHQGQLWYATELVYGPTLHAVVHRCGRLPVETVRHLGLGIIGALEAIHRSTVHRDLKPGNVLLVPDGPRVIDFGLAHLVGEDHGSSSVTAMGALGYAPPEQLASLGDAGKEADIYALGATLLFAATGHAAYTDLAEGLRGNVNLADLPDALFGVIHGCLHQDKKARPSLATLRQAFAARAAGPAGPRAFGTVLPARAVDVIREWREQLEQVIRQAGPADQEAPGAGNRSHTRPMVDTATRLLNERRQPNRTLIYPGTAPPPMVASGARNVRWQQAFGDWVRAPVAVAHRAVVAGSIDGTVACLDAESGEVISSLSLGGAVRWVTILPGGERAFAAAGDGGVHDIELRTGAISGTLFNAPHGIEGTPVEADGQLYTVSGSGLVYEIDVFSGDSKLLHDMGEPAFGALAAAYGLLFVSGVKGILAIHIASGRPRGLVPSTARVYSAPAAAAGRLYFAGTDGVLCSVNAETGQGQERVEIGAPVHKAIALDTSLELLYVAGADGHVRAFDISGRNAIRPAPLWQQRVGEEIGGITAADGIAHCTVDGAVTGLDGNHNGKQRYRVPLGGILTAAPTRYGQWIYVGGLDGGVSCLTMN